jgi:2-oxoglutarate dehydrogenase E2 component (dihydrolipoamide succinyltransferase)
MAKVELVMPKMGESIMEATILKWAKQVGDKIEEDETILEIATDKVDSEIPSPTEGVLTEILFEVDDVVPVGTVIAIIQTDAAEAASAPAPSAPAAEAAPTPAPAAPTPTPPVAPAPSGASTSTPAPTPSKATVTSSGTRFYSPLVKSIAKKENIGQAELDAIPGSGANGRVTKKDIMAYLANRGAQGHSTSAPAVAPAMAAVAASASIAAAPAASLSGSDELIQMDRMRKLIADHMVMSVQTSPHVTSFVEADVTNIVRWRNANKEAFKAKYGEKITFTPLIMEAVIKAIRDFPMVNVSVVDGDKIKVHKDINLGMAAALPTGNLIVPVIKNADHLNLAGLTKQVNDLAGRARANKLKPEDIQGGTYTLTNVGTFGNVMGTPIINQPQAAILAAGAIRKKPAVLETEHGDVIAVRHMMFLSHSYDHRVVDGFLGGSFVRRVADYLEAFDMNREI